jgi:hypothetical protein
MKPLRTGFAAGLLAGGVAAATRIVEERRAGSTERALVRTPSEGRRAPRKGAAGDARVTYLERRAARRAAANRPAWVVAPAPVAAVQTPASSRPLPTAPRKVASLAPLKQVSAKSVSASVGKFAVKRAGMAIGKVAADRVGKAIEVIEVLEKVVAAASETAPPPDLTPMAPVVDAPPPVAVLIAPVRPATDPSAKPTGTLVSVRKFERGPRVVVGRSVGSAPDEPAPAASPMAEETPVAAAVEAVAVAVETAIEEAAATAGSPESPDATTAVEPPPKKSPKRPSAKKSPARKSPAKTSPANKAPANKSPAQTSPGHESPAQTSPGQESPAQKSPARKAPAKTARPAADKAPRSTEPRPQADAPAESVTDDGAAPATDPQG